VIKINKSLFLIFGLGFGLVTMISGIHGMRNPSAIVTLLSVNSAIGALISMGFYSVSKSIEDKHKKGGKNE